MSYCEMLTWGGEAESVEFRNAWGFGAMVWSAVQRHLGWDDKWYDDPERRGWLSRWSNDGADVAPLWDLHKDPRVPADERIVHALTFDRIYVPAEHVHRVAEALRNFETAHRQPPAVCHLAAIAGAMERAVEQGATAVGFYVNSVSENPWVEFTPTEDDMDGTYRDMTPEADGTSIALLLPDLLPTSSRAVDEQETKNG